MVLALFILECEDPIYANVFHEVSLTVAHNKAISEDVSSSRSMGLDVYW